MAYSVTVDKNGYVDNFYFTESNRDGFFNIKELPVKDNEVFSCRVTDEPDEEGYFSLIFDEEKFKKDEVEFNEAVSEGIVAEREYRIKMRQLEIIQEALLQSDEVILQASQNISDEDLIIVEDKIPEWQIGHKYLLNQVIKYKTKLYRIAQNEVTAQGHQQPGETGMLAVYRPLAPNEGEADGSLEKPFEFVYGMDVVKGLYYLYNEKVYVANQAVDNCIWYPGQAGVYIFTLIK